MDTTSKSAARDTNTFAWRIKQKREALGLEQAEIAARVWSLTKHLPGVRRMSQTDYSHLETGYTKTPKLHLIAALSTVFDVSADWLITGKEAEQPAPVPPVAAAETFATPEAIQVARMLDDLDMEIRQSILETTRLLYTNEQRNKRFQAKLLPFLQDMAPHVPEENQGQARSIFEIIGNGQGQY